MPTCSILLRLLRLVHGCELSDHIWVPRPLHLLLSLFHLAPVHRNFLLPSHSRSLSLSLFGLSWLNESLFSSLHITLPQLLRGILSRFTDRDCIILSLDCLIRLFVFHLGRRLLLRSSFLGLGSHHFLDHLAAFLFLPFFFLSLELSLPVDALGLVGFFAPPTPRLILLTLTKGFK